MTQVARKWVNVSYIFKEVSALLLFLEVSVEMITNFSRAKVVPLEENHLCYI